MHPRITTTCKSGGLYLFAGLLFLAMGGVYGQSQHDSNRDSIEAATARDYADMLKQLGILSVRPGVNGSDPSAENPVNYEEKLANPYDTYPDPLITLKGKRIRSDRQWAEERRAELLTLFSEEIYGHVPQHVPNLRWEASIPIDESVHGFAVKRTALLGRAAYPVLPHAEVRMEVSLVLPSDTQEPVPVMVRFVFTYPPGYTPPRDADDWKSQLLEAGWGYAEIRPTTLQADNGAGLRTGLIGLANQGRRRSPAQWGSLRAWAWGASQLLDYFSSNPGIDVSRVGISGHSRYGKAALVTMAYDTRFAIAYISSSGAGGASLLRRHYGEVLENVAGEGEYHWMAGNFIRYAGPKTWGDLPVDAHELIALCAPRPVLIGTGEEGDQWADPRGMYLAARMASPVYELLGGRGIRTLEMPPAGTALTDGELAFAQHRGGHTAAPNWPVFVAFARKYIKR